VRKKHYWTEPAGTAEESESQSFDPEAPKNYILIFTPNPSEILLLHGHLFLFFRFSLCVAWNPDGFACGWGK